MVGLVNRLQFSDHDYFICINNILSRNSKQALPDKDDKLNNSYNFENGAFFFR